MASDRASSDIPGIAPDLPSGPPVEPRDAASLVLIRDGAAGPEVLMGRRPRTARFMPGVYVFPGGAVDKTDFILDSDRGLAGHVLARVGRKAAPPLAQALGWTAVRETWEETGLLFGAAGRVRGASDCPAVRAFAEAGLAPDLSALDYLMRAVTPPYIRIRFNTRFFIADGAAAQGMLQPCPELEEVGWHPIDAALGLSIVNVTEVVLNAAKRYWAERPPPDPGRPTPMFTQSSPGEVVLRDE
jgi:8-oxo-dGTP pyrophosphatase MutT (NUDIX family)